MFTSRSCVYLWNPHSDNCVWFSHSHQGVYATNTMWTLVLLYHHSSWWVRDQQMHHSFNVLVLNILVHVSAFQNSITRKSNMNMLRWCPMSWKAEKDGSCILWQTARSLRPRCVGEVDPETATYIYLSIYLSMYVYLSVYLSIYLSITKPVSLIPPSVITANPRINTLLYLQVGSWQCVPRYWSNVAERCNRWCNWDVKLYSRW
jgi:hypothetical protein